MTFGIYEAKRKLRAPLIWYGRRKYADAPPAVRNRLEHNAYRRAAADMMGATAADPHFIHRADLGSDAVVIDIGAFRGLVAQEIVDLYDCTVHAFEPNPDFYRELSERFADDPRVTTHEVGLGGFDATMTMEQRGLGSTVYRGSGVDPVDTVEVRIRDVVSVLDELGYDRIDYMKINIEGAEFDLLDRLIEAGWVDRTRYLLIQFHEWYEKPHVRRWQIRRHLRTTHDQVWNFPWIYELWCAKADPHPKPREYTKDELRKIREELIAEYEAKGSVEG